MVDGAPSPTGAVVGGQAVHMSPRRGVPKAGPDHESRSSVTPRGPSDQQTESAPFHHCSVYLLLTNDAFLLPGKTRSPLMKYLIPAILLSWSCFLILFCAYFSLVYVTALKREKIMMEKQQVMHNPPPPPRLPQQPAGPHNVHIPRQRDSTSCSGP